MISTVLIQVFNLCQIFQLSDIRERLEAVGLSSATAEHFMKMLVELDLLGEGQVSNLLAISEAMNKEERERLAEVLYTQLVYWLGQCSYNCTPCMSHVKKTHCHLWTCFYCST